MDCVDALRSRSLVCASSADNGPAHLIKVSQVLLAVISRSVSMSPQPLSFSVKADRNFLRLAMPTPDHHTSQLKQVKCQCHLTSSPTLRNCATHSHMKKFPHSRSGSSTSNTLDTHNVGISTVAMPSLITMSYVRGTLTCGDLPNFGHS